MKSGANGDAHSPKTSAPDAASTRRLHHGPLAPALPLQHRVRLPRREHGVQQQLFYGGEQSDCCERQCCGSSRSFTMPIVRDQSVTPLAP